MARTPTAQGDQYGGPWASEKLDILKQCLDAYTTALKNQHLKLIYIDAFAGNDKVELQSDDPELASLTSGSAKRAIPIKDKPFHHLVFVDKDPLCCQELKQLRMRNPRRSIQIESADANRFLQKFSKDWSGWRGVLFLDPFATEVEWTTIERAASFEALDMLMLFPMPAVRRMLPRMRTPDEVDLK